MSIITLEKGSFLQIDRTSVQETIGNTLKSLGIDYSLQSVARKKRSADPTKQGLRLYDTYNLGLGVDGPFGEEMRAVLRVNDCTVPGMAFTTQLGIFRLICLNGMFGFGEVFTQRIVHRTGDKAQDMLRALPDAIVASLQSMPALQAETERLAAIEIPDPIAVLQSLPIPESVREHALRVVSRGSHRPVDVPETAWGLYNIVNEVDRLSARKGSVAYLDRDERLVDDIVCLASAQIAA